MNPPALVVLAAGASRRLGEPKALCRLGARTAIEHLLTAGAWPGVTPLVVLGAEADPIQRALSGELEVLVNPDWALGRTGGLQRAAEQLPGRDVLVAPIDVPLVLPGTHRALREAWQAAGSPARGWLAPGRAKVPGGPLRPGHPILIGRELLIELARFGPDQALVELRSMAEPLWMIAVDDPGIHEDLDTQADREQMERRLGGAERST